MARKRKISASAINVRIHPHAPERYIALFRAAFALRRSVRVRGDTHLALSSLDLRSSNEPPRIAGNIARFTNIDTDLPWFDFEKLDEADDDALQKISIPPNLKPNLSSFHFMFDVTSHLFVYEHYSDGATLSQRQVSLFLDRLLNDNSIRDQFGPTNVTVVADHEQLDLVLGIPTLKRLDITIHRPNADDFGDLEKEIEEDLLGQNAKKLQIGYESAPGQSLQPNERTRGYAAVATMNGEVVAKGRDDAGIAESRSTADHPVVESDKYDPDKTSALNAFFLAATKLLDRLINN